MNTNWKFDYWIIVLFLYICDRDIWLLFFFKGCYIFFPCQKNTSTLNNFPPAAI